MKIFKKKDMSFVGSITGISGNHAESVFRLDKDEIVTLGRDPKTCQIVIRENCDKVSRTHCSVYANSIKNAYIVRDKSRNGTFINGVRIESGVDTEVPRGVLIAVGDMQNTFRLN